MTRDNIISRLCMLCAEVAEQEFDNEEASDCFCSVNRTPQGSFHFSEKVLAHIESCVRERKSVEKVIAHAEAWSKELVADHAVWEIMELGNHLRDKMGMKK